MEVKHFTIPETSKILKVKEVTVRAWIYQERLPVLRLGSRVFIKRETIDTVLEKGIPKQMEKT